MAASSSSAAGAKTSRAWKDDDDVPAEKQPAFLQRGAQAPSWAAPAGPARQVDEGADNETATAVARANKRRRREALEGVLASSAPLLTSAYQAKHAPAPAVMSRIPIAGKEVPTDVAWHLNGQLVVVATGSGLGVFHSSGSHVESVARYGTSVRGERQRPVQQVCLSADGECGVVRSQYAYYPSTVNLLTGHATALKFLDLRESTSFRHSGTTMSAKGKRFDGYLEAMSCPDAAAAAAAPTATAAAVKGLVAVSADRTLLVGSTLSGSVVHRITTPDPIRSHFFAAVPSAAPEIFACTAGRIHVFDTRRTAEPVRTIQDRGTVDGTVAAQSCGGALALGSASGVVSYFADPAACASGTPSKALRNLSTSIGGLAFSGDGSFVAMWSRDQKNGLRLATVADGGATVKVVPSFPPQTSRHEFIQCAAFNAPQSLLSVGEAGLVTNYRL